MVAKSKTSSIREKFGTDYLSGGSSDQATLPTSSPSGQVDPVEQAMAAYGGQILAALDKSAQKSARLHDLIDQINLPFETALGVTDRLCQLALVSILQRDKYGNHEIKITPAGSEFLRRP
jgi:predicted transcriptional regulator